MNIAATQEIKKAEDALIASGISAESLMEEAGKSIASLISREYPEPGLCVAYLGKGNNAGDALVVLRYLREAGWRIAVRCGYTREEGSPLYQKQWAALPGVEEWSGCAALGESGHLVLLDALVGLGASGALREPLGGLAREMNACRMGMGARIVSLDGPSGVDADTGEVYADAVVADLTAMIAVAKKGFLMDSTTGNVGRVCPVLLRGLEVPDNEWGKVFDGIMGRQILPPRPYEWYKGAAGRVSVVAGSPGMTGAARLCAESALRAGAGLVTLFVLPEVYPVLASSVIPEVMVKPVRSYAEVSEFPADALVIGPGLGRPDEEREEEVLNLIGSYKGKLVLDADGLNLLSRKGMQSLLASNHLITPHIGEMERLLPRGAKEARREWVERFTRVSSAVLLLKGARTITGQRGKEIMYNSTGGPAMGTAGQGDVLTGVCAALCAQGLQPYQAAALGAWLCGRASDIALRQGRISEQTLLASDTIDYLGEAFCFAL